MQESNPQHIYKFLTVLKHVFTSLPNLVSHPAIIIHIITVDSYVNKVRLILTFIKIYERILLKYIHNLKW